MTGRADPFIIHKYVYLYVLSKEGYGQRLGIWLFLFFRFAFGEGESVIEHLGDAAVAGFGGAVIEDAEQVAAALPASHGLPALIGAGIAGEGELQNGRQVEFGFHGGEQLFRDLLGAADAGWGIFDVGDPIAAPFAYGKGELLEPAAEGTVFVEDALEFGGDGCVAFFGVRFEAELRGVAGRGVRSSLHALVDGQAVKTLAGGEKRSPNGEAVDFALHSEPGACAPDFRAVERNAHDDPAEV